MWFNQYPYINLNDLNLDYLLRSLKQLRTDLENFVVLNTIKYADPIQWNITKQYEANTVVIDANDGTAYLSVKPVPSGVALTNTDYWTPIFTLNLLSANQNLTLRDDGSNVLATFASVAGDWLIWNNTLYKVSQPINVNEAYVVGYNLDRYTIEMFLNDAITAVDTKIDTLIGDLNDLNTVDKTNVVSAINEIFNRTRYNVKDYGAVGDGVTDDSAAIQACFDDMTSGGIAYFPEGRYLLKSAVSTTNQVSMLGAGAEATKILVDTAINGFSIYANYISIKNMFIDGGRVGAVGLELQGSFILIEDVVIAHWSNNLFLNGCAAVSAIKCYFVSSPNAVMIENTGSPDTGDNTFMSCTFDSSDSTGNGILFHSGGGLRVIGNKFLHYGTQINIAPASGVSTSVFTCVGNSFEASGTQALQLGGASGTYSKMVIVGNQFACDVYAIRVLSGVSYVKISDNFIEMGNSGEAFQMQNCSDIEISDNKIVGGALGIRGLSAINRLTIQHNDYSTKTPINLGATTYPNTILIDEDYMLRFQATGLSTNIANIGLPTGGGGKIEIEASGSISGVGYTSKHYEAIISYNGATYTVTPIDTSYATNDTTISISTTGVISLATTGGNFNGNVRVHYDNLSYLSFLV